MIPPTAQHHRLHYHHHIHPHHPALLSIPSYAARTLLHRPKQNQLNTLTEDT